MPGDILEPFLLAICAFERVVTGEVNQVLAQNISTVTPTHRQRRDGDNIFVSQTNRWLKSIYYCLCGN